MPQKIAQLIHSRKKTLTLINSIIFFATSSKDPQKKLITNQIWKQNQTKTGSPNYTLPKNQSANV